MTEHRREPTAPLLSIAIARAGDKARANIETVRTLLPSERQHTTELLHEGRVASVYLDVDGSTIFLIMPGDDESVQATLREFPLYDYFEWEVHRVREGIPDDRSGS